MAGHGDILIAQRFEAPSQLLRVRKREVGRAQPNEDARRLARVDLPQLGQQIGVGGVRQRAKQGGGAALGDALRQVELEHRGIGDAKALRAEALAAVATRANQ